MQHGMIAGFHQWLLSTGSESVSCGSILLIEPVPGKLAGEIAEQLNVYDDCPCAGWLAVTPELVQLIAADDGLRAMLGVPEPCPKCPPTSLCGLKKVLKAFAGRGRVVIADPLADAACGDLTSVFRIAVAPDAQDSPGLHAMIQPEFFPERSLPAMVCDLFLEWNVARHSQASPENPPTLSQSVPSDAA